MAESARHAPPPRTSAPDGAEQEIRVLLRAVARRRAWQGLLASAAWALGAAGLALLVALAVALVGGGAGVVIAAAAATLVAGLVATALGTAGPAIRRARSTEWRARVVDRAAGGDAVWCAVELGEQRRAGALVDPFGVRRLESHLARTAAAVRTLRPVGVVAWSAADRAALAGPVVLLLAAGALALPGAAERLFGALRPEPVVAPWSAAPDEPELVLRDVVVRLTPPPYTGLPARTLPSGSGSFAALPGTEVTVEADVGATVDAVTFRLGDGPVQAGEVIERARVRVAFVVGEARGYRLEVVSPARPEPLRTGVLRIDLLEDAAPLASVSGGPQEVLDWEAAEQVSAVLEAEDDYGLLGGEWVLRRGEEELARGPALRLDGAPRSLARELVWSRPALAPGGGDLTLALEVRDNDTVRGPKGTRVEVATLRSYTAEDRRREVLDAQAALLERTLAALGSHLLWDHALDLGDVPAAGQEAARAGERMEALLQAAAVLRDTYGRDPEPDPAAVSAAGTAVDEVARSWDRLQQQQRRQAFDRDDEEDDAALVDALGEHVGSLERAALVLDRLLATARWDAVRAASREAARAMQALQDALEAGDQAAIDAAMVELQRRLDELQRRMLELDSGRARELANAATGGPVGPDLAGELQRLLAEGRTAEAMELLARTEQSMAQLEGLQGQPGMDPAAMAAAMAKLDTAVERAEALATEQEALNDALEALQERYPGASAPTGVEPLREDLAALRERVAGLAREGMDPRMVRSVRDRAERADEYLEDADRGLAWGDADRALRGLARSDHEVLDLVDLAGVYADAGASGLSADELDAYGEELDAVERAHTELIERLLMAERGWRQARTEAAEAGSDEVARQQSLADDAASFQGDLDELGPLMGGGGAARRDLRQAERWMRATAGDAEVGQTGRAVDSGREAAARMRAVQRELESTRETIQSGGQGGAQPLAASASGWQYFEGRHRGVDRGTVEVPPPERFQTPEELRRAALEAALEDAPPRYRELNDAYYEELLR